MYCEFYGFREKPFNITPNPRFIFLSKNHREAFAHLLYGIDNHGGFIELTGEVGTGKTTVLRTLFEQLDERGHRTALIFNPCLSVLDLMRSINREFGISWEGLSISELLDALNRFLLSENTAGRTVVLVIDEAQNLEPHVLEQVRLISNLETKTDKLIQIVLAGQPELGRLLNSSALRQISQRITVSYHLAPMDFEDSKAYIEHRLEIAGDWRAASFTPQALKKVFRYSGGVPRLINILCDRALLFGYVEENREISARMVNAAITEIRREERSGRLFRPREILLGISAILAVIGVLAGHYWAPRGFPLTPTFQRTAPVSSPLLLVRELSGSDESKSAITAFNALAKLWNVPPVSDQTLLKKPLGLDRAAAQRGLELHRYSGSLGLLSRMGYPAILEFTLPGVKGKRYLALTGLAQGTYYVAPPLAGRSSLSSAELEKFWSGVAYLPWKNSLNIPLLLTPGTKGSKALALQQLLLDARLLNVKKSGVFDRESVAAVRAFQTTCGILPDGKAGSQTLLLLYRAGRKFPGPTLEKPEENQKR